MVLRLGLRRCRGTQRLARAKRSNDSQLGLLEYVYFRMREPFGKFLCDFFENQLT